MKKLWFKRKRYGWGWTPSTSEGWLVTLIYIFTIFMIFLQSDNSADREKNIFLFILATIVFLVITVTKGEKPKWQWGEDDKK